jgi:DNA-directed RNA polymerase
MIQSPDAMQALAACKEITAALQYEGGHEAFPSGLPVHQDGSCNGLQHYAALGRDAEGGKQVGGHVTTWQAGVGPGMADALLPSLSGEPGPVLPAPGCLHGRLRARRGARACRGLARAAGECVLPLVGLCCAD